MGGDRCAGSGKAKRVGLSSITDSSCGIRASAFTRACAWRALDALARKRSMKDWICARSAVIFSTARFCCKARSVRMRTNSSNPPGVSDNLPLSRCAMESTARSSRPRSCETTTAAPGNFASQPSSHIVASKSRWLVGSSRSRRSGLANSAVASATRMRQPPENEFTGRAWAASSKPSPARMVAARAGAESAPMERKRSCTSPSRCGSAISNSANRERRSSSPCSTISSSDRSPDGASCFTCAMRAREARRISPPSGVSPPEIAFSSVDLPAPLRPTRPIRRPGSTVRSASSSRRRPPRRMDSPEIRSRLMAVVYGETAPRRNAAFTLDSLPQGLPGWRIPSKAPRNVYFSF